SAASTHAIPSPASPTTSMSSNTSRNVRRPCRTTWWSSTISTRMGSDIGGHLQPYSSAGARRGGDLESAADRPGPLPHRCDAQPPGCLVRAHGMQAVPVIDDLDDHRVVPPPVQPDVDVPGVGVAKGVV